MSEELDSGSWGHVGQYQSRKRTVSLNTGPVALANKDIQSYYDQPCLEDSEPWALKPEIPSEEEILGTDSGDTLDLEPNNIDGPWISKEAYLRTHYNLLREDSVAPLRDAVAYVRERPHMMDSKDVSIYDQARPCFVLNVRRL